MKPQRNQSKKRSSKASSVLFIEEVRQSLSRDAHRVFEDLVGLPVRKSGRSWRAKNRSSFVMEMAGPKRGLWIDHKASTGGNLFDLFAIERLHLSSADDDFPAVLQDAASWLGIRPPTGEAEMQARQERIAQMKSEQEQRDNEAHATAEAEASAKAQLVEDIERRCQSVKGSPAASYLWSRNIGLLPEVGLAFLPPCPELAGEYFAGARNPSLLIWAMDDQGERHGGQRVLITQRGQRAKTNGADKPCFGNVHGFPARFAAREERDVLCVCEGPETALAVWQATGYETWAVFGVSGWAAAPLPKRKKVVLCPDRDPQGSPAHKAFAKAALGHVNRGVDVWVALAPEEPGSKKDLADTLVRDGEGAVIDAISGAIEVKPQRRVYAPSTATGEGRRS